MDEHEYTAAKDVARTNRAFYEALRDGDFERMRCVWARNAKVMCVHPGMELLAGHDRVMASWAAIFSSGEKRSFEIIDVSIDIAGDLAWVTNLERFRNPVPTDAVATNLYRKTADGWRMILHHASPVVRRMTGPPPGGPA